MKENKKDFIWVATRISFWLMLISAYALSYLDVYTGVSALLVIVFTLFCFVFSIMHLSRYKEKAFAILALVFSSIYVLEFLVSAMLSYLHIQ